MSFSAFFFFTSNRLIGKKNQRLDSCGNFYNHDNFSLRSFHFVFFFIILSFWICPCTHKLGSDIKFLHVLFKINVGIFAIKRATVRGRKRENCGWQRCVLCGADKTSLLFYYFYIECAVYFINMLALACCCLSACSGCFFGILSGVVNYATLT